MSVQDVPSSGEIASLNDAPSPKDTRSLGENPYWVFVSFLYAFIAADIASRFASLSTHWYVYGSGQPDWWHVPIWSHLTLAAVLVATSWLGWTLAFVDGDVTGLDFTTLRGVIVPTSLLLIVDFWVLGTYFAFVSVVNEARVAGKFDRTWSPQSGLAAYWIMWALIAYFAWDFLVYFLIPKLNFKMTRFWSESWMSVLCPPLSFLAYLCLRHMSPGHPFWMLAADCSLLALLLFYRVLKQLARPSDSWQKQLLRIAPFSKKVDLAGEAIQGPQKQHIDLPVIWEVGFARAAFLAFIVLLVTIRATDGWLH